MKPHKVEPDDEISRVRLVYLGAPGMTLPWHARYTAYLLGLSIFLGMVVIEAILPFVSIGIPPMWELATAILGTSVIMLAVDHDKPPIAVVRNIITVYRVRRVAIPTPQRTRPTLPTMKITRYLIA